MQSSQEAPPYDLLIVGAGINGAGLARDAARRGLRVALCERGDLGCATSSASSKLIHGGLRYLEHYAFGLVRESLAERETLLRLAPHLVHPLQMVLPHVPGMRPYWLVRTGLFLYDHLARRGRLPGSHGLRLREQPHGEILRPECARGFTYADCWVDDARLVVANVRDAAEHGADVRVGTAFTGARFRDGAWEARLTCARTGASAPCRARALVNVAGPWVGECLASIEGARARGRVRLVKGSHVVVPRLYRGDHAYILQNDDGRVVFVLPFERDFSLVGTTEVMLDAPPAAPAITPEETRYLLRAAARYLARPPREADIVWSFAGVRPLYDDGRRDPSAITRDYVLEVDTHRPDNPVLSVYGGKLTTYRHLAEVALQRLRPWFPRLGPRWTAEAVLPGGDLPAGGVAALLAGLRDAYPRLPTAVLAGLARRHGTRAHAVLGGARHGADLGVHFGADLTAREVDYLIETEWARAGEDVLWRRTKAGLRLDAAARERVSAYVARHPRASA